MIAFRPLTAALGAEVSGVDLTAPLDPAVVKTLHDGLLEHQVLFFRDQAMEPEHHLALSRAFGEPVAHPAYPHVDGFPMLTILLNTPDKPPKIDTFHTDMTFLERPPLGSILRGVEIPEQGGDTMWASLFSAYDGLSDRMKAYLEGMTAVHSFAHGFRESIGEPGGLDKFASTIRDNPPIAHPVIRTHPESGRKGLFVNRLFTTHLEGVGTAESNALLRFLFDHLETPEFSCRFRWRPNSVAFWDNRATIHRPVNDFWPARRRMERITIAGDRPC